MKLLKKIRYLIGQGAFHIMLGTFLTKFVAFFWFCFCGKNIVKRTVWTIGIYREYL